MASGITLIGGQVRVVMRRRRALPIGKTLERASEDRIARALFVEALHPRQFPDEGGLRGLRRSCSAVERWQSNEAGKSSAAAEPRRCAQPNGELDCFVYRPLYRRVQRVPPAPRISSHARSVIISRRTFIAVGVMGAVALATAGWLKGPHAPPVATAGGRSMPMPRRSWRCRSCCSKARCRKLLTCRHE